MKRLIFTGEDGIVAIVVPAMPDGVKCEAISTADIPTDRAFRDAWIQEGASIKIDMARARKIHMEKIQISLDKKLDETQKTLLLDQELGNDTTALKAERQRLRAIPKNFDLEKAQTPEELKDLWPLDLPR